MRQKLEKIGDFDRSGIIDKIANDWVRFFHVGTQNEIKWNREFTEALGAKVRDIWNLPDLTTTQRFGIAVKQRPEAQIYNQLATETLTITFVPPDAKDADTRTEQTLTLDSALLLYLGMRQPDLVDNMAFNGYDDITRQELIRQLPDKVLELGDYMTNNLEREYDTINPIYVELFGINMPHHQNYFPFRPKFEKPVTADTLNEAITDLKTMQMPSAFIARRRHRVRFDIDNGAVDTFIRHKSNMNRLRAFIGGSKDFFSIYGHNEMRKSLIVNFGDEFYDQLTRHASQIVSGGNNHFAADEDIEFFRGLFVYKSLGGNLGVFLKQLTSIPAYFINMPASDFAKAIATWATPQGIEDIRNLMQTDYIQNRWDQGNHIEAMFVLKNGREKGWLQRALAASMITTRVGDMIPILIMGRVLYNNTFTEAKARGMSDAQAAAEAELVFGLATDETQQSSAWKDRTHWQRSSTLGQLLSMFQTTPRQYTTTGMRAAQRALKRRDKDSTFQMSKVLFTMFVLLPAAFKLITDVFNHGIRGLDDDRDDEELYLDYVSAILKSPLTGIYFVRYISDNLIDGLVVGKKFFTSDVPLTGLDQDFLILSNSGYGYASGDKDAGDVIQDIGRVIPAVGQTRDIITRGER